MSDTAQRQPFLRFPLVIWSKMLGLMPARVADAFLAGLARIVYWRGRAQHASVLQDFRDNVDPTAQFSSRKWRPVQAMYRALLRNANDTIWFLAATHAAALRRFRIEDPSPIHAALEAGRPAGVGAIVAFPHLGSYAAIPIVLALNGLPTTAVINRQPALMQWVIERGAQKTQLELIVIERTGGGSITGAMADALRRGRIVAIAGDYFRAREGAQGGVSKGIEVDLAGIKRPVGPGPALLAVRTGALIVPGAVFQDKHQREPVFGQPISAGVSLDVQDQNLTDAVQITSQRVADALAKFIEREPDQWLMPGGLVSDSIGRRRPTAGG
ncbi:MAG: phosphatidylinositol dimannoside acyltransferase [Mycobacterium sp.]|jgi:lauroyl/myristoyl acyltransferase|nr:phosphatidylinositol dimannoside acyltransferase [Mycobacterium sp.]MDT5174206.1 phosphatidylinositol dimannoside acyltransferase [Mycobacterium sp.]